MPKRFKLGRTTLKRNARHSDIGLVQNYLRRFGYLGKTTTVKADVLDAKTSSAVARFQRQLGLTVTGSINRSTKQAMVARRCGNQDASSDSSAAAVSAGYKTVGCKLNSTRVTYSFGAGTGDVPGTQERDAIRRALATWSKVCALSFEERTSNGTLRFSWATDDHGDGEPFDGSGNTLAHAFYPRSCGGSHRGRCHFDDDEGWRITGSGIDVETVALHEIGHLIGLKHSTKSGAVMFPTYGGQRRSLTHDDIAGATSLYRGNVHIQAVKANGQVGGRVGTRQWTEGWTQAVPFTVGSKSFLFLLKERGAGVDKNNVHIHSWQTDGDVGGRVASYKWSEGWTTASFYTLKGKTYLFLLKKRGAGGDGKNVHIHRMNTNGKVGRRVASYKWSTGWTQAVPFKVGSKSFLFLLKASGLSGSKKNVHIHALNANGSVGRRIADYKWTSGWSTVTFYTINRRTFLFLLKKRGVGSDKKNVHIHEMKSNGSVGRRVASYKWTSGWTQAVAFRQGAQDFLFLLKEKGKGSDGNNVHLHKLSSSGRVGRRVADYKWTSGWSSVAFYKLKSKLRLFLLKKKG